MRYFHLLILCDSDHPVVLIELVVNGGGGGDDGGRRAWWCLSILALNEEYDSL